MEDLVLSPVEVEFEEFRHKAVNYFLEMMVRYKPSMKPEKLNKVLKKARSIEEKILDAATTQQDYCARVFLKLVRLDRKVKYRLLSDSKGNRDMTPDNLRIRGRLEEMMQNLDLAYEFKSSNQLGNLRQGTTEARKEEKFRIAHSQRLKQEDAEDVSYMYKKPNLLTQSDVLNFESREIVWPKVQQLKAMYLSELTKIRYVLRETTKLTLRSEQEVHVQAWTDVLDCIIDNLSTSKQDLPEKFKPGTALCLEKQVRSTTEFFRECLRLPDDYASTSAGATPSETGLPSKRKSESGPSISYRSQASSSDDEASRGSRSEGEPSTSYSSSLLSESSPEIIWEISRFLLDLQRSREHALSSKRREEPSTSTRAHDRIP